MQHTDSRCICAPPGPLVPYDETLFSRIAEVTTLAYTAFINASGAINLTANPIMSIEGAFLAKKACNKGEAWCKSVYNWIFPATRGAMTCEVMHERMVTFRGEHVEECTIHGSQAAKILDAVGTIKPGRISILEVTTMYIRIMQTGYSSPGNFCEKPFPLTDEHSSILLEIVEILCAMITHELAVASHARSVPLFTCITIHVCKMLDVMEARLAFLRKLITALWVLSPCNPTPPIEERHL
jgi:hypothetical protein